MVRCGLRARAHSLWRLVFNCHGRYERVWHDPDRLGVYIEGTTLNFRFLLGVAANLRLNLSFLNCLLNMLLVIVR